MSVKDIRRELHRYRSRKKAKILSRFFKTGPGEYGEGDVFIGVVVPHQRAIAKKHFSVVKIAGILRLLKSSIHEERLTALIMLVLKFNGSGNGRPDEKAEIYKAYLKHTAFINNWDLVDISAQHIVGAYLDGKDKKPLYRLARSPVLWERRIAMISTFYYIRKGRFDEALDIAGILVTDREDLIQKAVGWMLREIGKRNLAAECGFLDKHAKFMPRTMLRYAIELFPERQRRGYLISSKAQRLKGYSDKKLIDEIRE